MDEAERMWYIEVVGNTRVVGSILGMGSEVVEGCCYHRSFLEAVNCEDEVIEEVAKTCPFLENRS